MLQPVWSSKLTARRLELYWRALRPFSFPASVFPSLTGSVAAAALHSDEPAFTLNPLHLVLALVGCVAIHAVSNLLNDYFDWRSGLDQRENSGRMNPLVQGLLTAKEFLRLTAAVAAVAVAIGVYFIATCWAAVTWIVAVGALSAWAYTAPPLQLKYRALGELQVMLSFGILMTLGSYVTQAWHVMTTASELAVVQLSLPQSLLIAAILHANNHRDRLGDRKAGAHTLALLVGSSQRSVAVGKLLVWGAFVVHGLIVLGSLGERYAVSPATLLAWLSFAQARRALALLPGSDCVGSPQFVRVVPAHARLQQYYGGLMVVGLALAAVLPQLRQ